MHPRITLITLGVDDLERSVAFYRDGLGLPTDGIVGTEFAHGAVAFFDLQAGLRLALWPRASLAHDVGLPLAMRAKFPDMERSADGAWRLSRPPAFPLLFSLQARKPE